MERLRVMVLGIGNLLFTDEGFGIRVIQRLLRSYSFGDDVVIEDGGVLGVNLLGIITEARHLIVVDAIRNRGKPGDIYRLEGSQIPERIRCKNSLHQVDFLEALTLCQALGHVPETVIIGVEPEDIETLGTELTPVVEAKVDKVVDMVLAELKRVGAHYEKGATHVSCDPLKDCRD